MKAITFAHFVGRDGARVAFEAEHGACLVLSVLDDALIRVALLRPEGWRLDRTWSIAPGGLEPPFEGRSRDSLDGFPCPDFTVTEADGTVTVTAPGLVAVVRLAPLGIAWHLPGQAEPFAQDRPTQAYWLSRRGGALAHHMARRPEERHHGLGDKAGPYDRTGRRFKLDAVDPCGFDAETSDPLYKIIPFTIVDRDGGPAHGVFYDNLAVGEADYGCTLDNYHGLFRSYRADDGDLDYYMMAGPRMADVVARYVALTGGQAFPPAWSLGFGCTSMSIADAPDADARVTAFIEDCRRHAIPCDSFHFGSGYSSIGPRRYVFNWNHDKFPDPAATMARLSAAGMRPVTNIKPCLLDDHPRLADAMAKDILVRDGDTGRPAVAQFWDGLGYHVDFTNPAGLAWWRAGLESTLLDFGVVSAWNDNNEFEIWDEDALCDGAGRPFPQSLARPVQALLMTKLSFETQAARAPGTRPYAITRAGGPGLGRYAQTWSGDNYTAWKTLRWNLRQGLGMSLSGLFNIGHDVGGFHGPTPGPELFCRFVEFCCLWPRFVMNSWKSDGVVTLPWMHASVLPQVQEAYRLRYRLMPALYTAMWQGATRHRPPVRPLGYAFPDDRRAVREDETFMLGDDLLVAPVLDEGATRRALYLPEHPGGWYDFHEGTFFAPGSLVEVAAPLGHLPVFVRAGALLPVGEQTDRVDPASDMVRLLRVYAPRRPGRIETAIYDDDGDSAGFAQGLGCVTHLVLDTTGPEPVLSARREGAYVPAYGALRVVPVGFDTPPRIDPDSEGLLS